MNIIIADKSPLVGEGIGMLVRSFFTNAAFVVSESSTDLVKRLKRSNTGEKIELLLVDEEIALGITPTQLKQFPVETKVCLMTSLAPDKLIHHVTEQTFDCVISKFSAPQDLRQTINKLMIDRSFFPSTTFKKGQITKREMEILSLMAEGLSNKEIARRCYLVEGTVKRHLSNIFKKLNVQNRVKATHVAIEKNLIP